MEISLFTLAFQYMTTKTMADINISARSAIKVGKCDIRCGFIYYNIPDR